MKVSVTITATNDNGSEFSQTVHSNSGLEKAEAITLRDTLTNGVSGIYNSLPKNNADWAALESKGGK